MDNAKMEEMLLKLIEELDYDLWKSFIPDLSESDDDEISDRLDRLKDIVKKYL